MKTWVKLIVCGVALGVLGVSIPLQALTPPPATTVRIDASAAPVSAAAHGDMITVPAGEYPIGHPDGGPHARPTHTVTLSAFAMDRTEVTNEQYAEFLNALDLAVQTDFPYSQARKRHFSDATWPELLEMGTKPGLYPIIGLDDQQVRIEARNGQFVAAKGFEDHPVAESTWRGARDYCAWRGARLPTEVEWEAAARGTEGRIYPWGDARPDEKRAYVGFPSGVTAPVGSRPRGATPRGLLDMAGSMAEWTSSLFKPYPYDADDGREDPSLPGERVTRGGDYVFDTRPDKLTGYFRAGFSRAPEDGHRHIGFRCAKSIGS